MTQTTRQPLSTGGHAWGPQRVALGLSIRQLADLSGVNRGILSMVEAGRMVPTGDQWQAVMGALDKAKQPESAA